eukprot:190450-Rhodomonas_salina.1
MQIDPDNICFLPVRQMAPDYELLAGRAYPLIFCDAKRETHSGYVLIANTLAEIVLRETLEDDCSRSARKEVHVDLLTVNLMELNVLVYALVHRRNAVVYTEAEGYGVILPCPGAPGTYFDKELL